MAAICVVFGHSAVLPKKNEKWPAGIGRSNLGP